MAAVRDILNSKGGHVFCQTNRYRGASRSPDDRSQGWRTARWPGQRPWSALYPERDMVRHFASGGTRNDLVSGCMTTHVHSVTPTTTLEHCMLEMTKRHIRHLPVIVDDTVIGIVFHRRLGETKLGRKGLRHRPAQPLYHRQFFQRLPAVHSKSSSGISYVVRQKSHTARTTHCRLTILAAHGLENR